jgi:dihydrolipoamide dehydrogenase
MSDTRTHLLIIGGGPAGTQAATTAAMKGGRVTLIEKDIVGGAAHLWDCIPSKTMAASALRHTSVRDAVKLGLVNDPGRVDPRVLSERITEITADINTSWINLLDSQQVDIIRGTGRFVGPSEAIVETADGDRRVSFDKALISTGSAPRRGSSTPCCDWLGGHRGRVHPHLREHGGRGQFGCLPSADSSS